jgi:chromosome segregation ATPase
MKPFTISIVILFFLTFLSAGESTNIDTRKEFEFYKEKIIDLEKKLDELADILEEENQIKQTVNERFSLLEGALNELSLERKEEERRLSQIEKYLQENKTILLGINETLTEQGNKQVELTKEIGNLKEKLKKIEENLVILSKEINELHNRKIEIPLSERKLHSKNPKIDRYLEKLESPWVAPIALGIAFFTFLLVIF